jgi:hypothetical protein
MTRRPDAFLCSIGYAEDWLRRARHDWRSGNAPAAVRRLMLAEAEIHHARETAAASGLALIRRGAAGSGGRLLAGLAAAAVLAAGVGYAWMQGIEQAGPVAVRGTEGRVRGNFGRTIVQLDTGRLLMVDPAGGAPGEGSPHLAAPWPLGSGLQRSRNPRDPEEPVGVPVDLKTSSPTF